MPACTATRPTSLSDAQLLSELHNLVRDDRRLTARMLLHLAEVDARKLYLVHACSSMHVYCVERLHMSDPQAYRRIHAARAARRFPRIFGMVARNELHLTGIALLSQFLTEENHEELLEAAVHQCKRQIEQLLAERFPKPDVAAEQELGRKAVAAKISQVRAARQATVSGESSTTPPGESSTTPPGESSTTPPGESSGRGQTLLAPGELHEREQPYLSVMRRVRCAKQRLRRDAARPTDTPRSCGSCTSCRSTRRCRQSRPTPATQLLLVHGAQQFPEDD